jgi:3-phenylpropionate/trans-cinnamate dioxygenase ferredoxin subunit
VAVLNDCPHFGGPLAQGAVSVARGEIICPWHRFRFDLSTGQSVTNPAMVAPLLATEVRGDRVWVDVTALAGAEE